MHHTRNCAVVLLGAGSLVLLCYLPTVLARTGLHADARSSAPLPTTADLAAVSLLDQALAGLDPVQHPFLETNVWQHVSLPDLDYSSEGRYVVGTEQRYRMEIHTRVGGREGALVQVCDGSSLWQGTRTENGPWLEVRRIQLAKTNSGVNMPTDLEARGFAFSGVRPLLSNLRQQLLWVRQEKTLLQDADCILLTGVWPAAQSAALAPADQPWPEDLPKQCRLWLDSRTLWPRRVEWIGAGNATQPLVEMELRAPRFLTTMSPERCQQEFTFDSGNTPVINLSEPGAKNPTWQETKRNAVVF
jgi:hypothetical protein